MIRICLVALLLAGCTTAPDSDASETTDDAPDEWPWREPVRADMEGCQVQRTFVDLDPAVDAMVPDGYAPSDGAVPLSRPGYVDVFSCPKYGAMGEPAVMVLAGLAIIDDNDQFGFLALDILVDSDELAPKLAELQLNVTQADIELEETVSGLSFSAVAEGLRWEGTHVRTGQLQGPDALGYTSVSMWHANLAEMYLMEVVLENYVGLANTALNPGKNYLAMEGGVLPEYAAPAGFAAAAYSLDYKVDAGFAMYQKGWQPQP